MRSESRNDTRRDKYLSMTTLDLACSGDETSVSKWRISDSSAILDHNLWPVSIISRFKSQSGVSLRFGSGRQGVRFVSCTNPPRLHDSS